jgi:hypothetical protein
LYNARSIPKLAKEAIGRKLGLRELCVAEAALQMVVYQAGGLHQRVNDGWSHETEASLFQILA